MYEAPTVFIAPGLTKALEAARSSNLSTPILIKRLVYGVASAWNTPLVYPSLSVLYTLLSSKGISERLICLPERSLIDFNVSAITDNVLSPRASILISPMSATVSISYATTGILPETSSSESALDSTGANFLKSSLATTTPAA